jgi:hypothetical protein
MIKCGGCGRDIYPESLNGGEKYLCIRCLYVHRAGRESSPRRSHVLYAGIVVACLAAMGLAGLAICLFYLSGTGRLLWFILLFSLMLFVVALPGVILSSKRNLTLIISSLYLPLSIWSFLWFLAPNVHWEYGNSTAYGAFCFLGLGLLSLSLFIRDLRALPRF